MLTLTSATPSPCAHNNRIAMLEKGIPFEPRNEIPWHSTTEMLPYNPLEILPILISDDGRPVIYESWYMQEYIVQKTQIPADGARDAMGLTFFETGRGELKSEEWYARQLRKVNGVLNAMDELEKKTNCQFLVCSGFSIADIAAGAMLDMMNMVETQFGLVEWLDQYPELKRY